MCVLHRGEVGLCGPDYEKGTLPRLLFLSLDSGSADRDPERRTPEAVRLQETTRDVGNLPKGRHWYRTHELASVLLWQFGETLTPENVSPHFAHANSAKCCMNKAHRSLADDRLFHNCREYLPGYVAYCVQKLLSRKSGHGTRLLVEVDRLTKE